MPRKSKPSWTLRLAWCYASAHDMAVGLLVKIAKGQSGGRDIVCKWQDVEKGDSE